MAVITFRTLGCKVNQYETEKMKQQLKASGYQIIDKNSGIKPDIAIINSCCVTHEAARQSRQYSRKLKRAYPEVFVVLLGCYSDAFPLEATERAVFDLMLSAKDKENIVDIIARKFSPSKAKVSAQRVIGKTRIRALLKVQDGCDAFCAYCIVPYARGPSQSRPLQEIIDEATFLTKAGFKEIVLTGIHLGFYGRDLSPRCSLTDLIEELLKTEIYRLRLSSLEMNELNQNIIEMLQKNNALCPHLHLPLQSGSAKILKTMNRNYDPQQFLQQALLLKQLIPNLALTTDVMVGFPNETAQDFKMTVKLIEAIGFSRVHVFSYSRRKGTKAYQMPQQVSGKVKKERSQILRSLATQLQHQYLEQQLGLTSEVLIESIDQQGVAQGTTPNYLKVFFQTNNNQRGDLVMVKAKNIKDDGLWGEEVS